MGVHRFEITYTEFDAVTTPDPAASSILVGDTVTFDCPGQKLFIEWVENVFNQPSCAGGEALTVEKAGTFRGVCSIIQPNGVPLPLAGRGTEGQTQSGEQGSGTT